MFEFAAISNRRELFQRASQIAHQLIYGHALQCPDGTIRKITAVEFYLYIPGVWEDGVSGGGATHEHPEQLKHDTFYIHSRQKKNLEKGISFQAPNRSGIDITCGDGKNYGGILLRALDGRDGPALALRAIIRGAKGLRPVPRTSILNRWSVKEKSLLQKMNGQSIRRGALCLIPQYNDGPLWQGPRENIAGTRFAQEPLQFSTIQKNGHFKPI
jgi:hypothetical protein